MYITIIIITKIPTAVCHTITPVHAHFKGMDRHGDCSIPTHSIAKKKTHCGECHACLTFNIHLIVLLEVTLTTLINSDFADITFHAAALETEYHFWCQDKVNRNLNTRMN